MRAQTYRHSVGIGAEQVGLDAPDGIGNRYLVRYTRHLRQDRLALQGALGYASVLNRRYLVNNYFIEGRRRERFTADVTLAFDFLKSPRQALRLGAGPSAWYRREELLESARYTLSSTGEVTNVRPNWRSEQELNWGYNLLLEYEYALTSQLVVSGNVKLVSVNAPGTGFNAIYGLGVGYRW
ncbi:MAG: hypothetical protein WKG07_10415 [Hymenobacter sp.]